MSHCIHSNSNINNSNNDQVFFIFYISRQLVASPVPKLATKKKLRTMRSRKRNMTKLQNITYINFIQNTKWNKFFFENYPRLTKNNNKLEMAEENENNLKIKFWNLRNMLNIFNEKQFDIVYRYFCSEVWELWALCIWVIVHLYIGNAFICLCNTLNWIGNMYNRRSVHRHCYIVRSEQIRNIDV